MLVLCGARLARVHVADCARADSALAETKGSVARREECQSWLPVASYLSPLVERNESGVPALGIRRFNQYHQLLSSLI